MLFLVRAAYVKPAQPGMVEFVLESPYPGLSQYDWSFHSRRRPPEDDDVLRTHIPADPILPYLSASDSDDSESLGSSEQRELEEKNPFRSPWDFIFNLLGWNKKLQSSNISQSKKKPQKRQTRQHKNYA